MLPVEIWVVPSAAGTYALALHDMDRRLSASVPAFSAPGLINRGCVLINIYPNDSWKPRFPFPRECRRYLTRVRPHSEAICVLTAVGAVGSDSTDMKPSIFALVAASLESIGNSIHDNEISTFSISPRRPDRVARLVLVRERWLPSHASIHSCRSVVWASGSQK